MMVDKLFDNELSRDCNYVFIKQKMVAILLIVIR
jgi:hypothetical protein